MKSVSNHKNGWMLLLFILIGIVLGSFIAEITSTVPALEWLSFGKEFGLPEDFKIELGVLFVAIALKIRLTIAGIIGVVIALVIYRFI